MIGIMFLAALGLAIVILIIKALRSDGPGKWRDGGWGGRGKDPRPKGPPPKDPGPDLDGLLEVPLEWIEAHGKWAKKIVKDSYDRIKVQSGAR